MGQYYTLCNIDKRQRLSCSLSHLGTMFFSGQKLTEMLENLGFKPLLALALLDLKAFTNDLNPLWGSWSGDRVVLLGDYCDAPPDFLTDEEKLELETKSKTLPQLVSAEFEDLVKDVKKWFTNNDRLGSLLGSREHVIVNLDKFEYMDPEEFGDYSSLDEFCLERGGVLRGLYSTLFYSSGTGGGDIEALKIGRWAGDRLSIVEKNKLSEWYCEVSDDIQALLNQAR